MQDVRGHLAFLGILEFLQVALFHHRSALLAIQSASGDGDILLADGSVADARLGERRGTDALFPLLQSALDGEFRLLPPPDPLPPSVIELTTEQILMRILGLLPPEAQGPVCRPDWRIEGTVALLGAAEILQIFESNKRPARCVFTDESGDATRLLLAEGGIVEATSESASGAEAIYRLMARSEVRFEIVSPEEPPVVERMLDIASVVMEGSRRLDEERLLSSELIAGDNPHAQEMLEALENGALDESARIALAKRYLPGGRVAPAVVVARLTADPSEAVRRSAMESLHDLPVPVIEAFANDPETPVPLLHYLVLGYGEETVAGAALANRATPLGTFVEYALRAPAAHMPLFRKREDFLAESRELRQALRANPHCDFVEFLDATERARPKMRKRTFTAVLPRVSETAPEKAIVLAKPEPDPRKEKPKTRIGPKELQYLAKRGSLRQKMDLVCGTDDEIAVEIVSQPGIPESFIAGVAESTAANGAALRAIASDRSFRQNAGIIRALVTNPKTPVPAATGLLSLVRPDVLEKIATSRDLPDGTRQAARQLLDKRQKKKKG